MDTTLKAAIFLIGYILLPFFLGTLLLLWGIKKRGERPPVEFVLRRGPGESLRRKIAKMDEDMPIQMSLVSFCPLIAGWLLLLTINKFGLVASYVAVALAGVILLLGMAGICIWTLRHFKKRRNYLLGYLGERAVAEELEPLMRDGYHVFHDVPSEKVEGSFNLDHVVVGPTGLFAIETKTRRKGRAREGFEEHKVFYDGRQLIWPWAEDIHGLKQAQNEAEWLTKWVKQMTGIAIAAKPVLALPGWWVETRALGPVSVQNAKNLSSHIRAKGLRLLDDAQIDLIARQLDVRCRDVKD
jgi:hypothetical protein